MFLFTLDLISFIAALAYLRHILGSQKVFKNAQTDDDDVDEAVVAFITLFYIILLPKKLFEKFSQSVLRYYKL